MIRLQKGQKIDLTKGQSGIRHLLVGLGWESGHGVDFDLDTAAFLLGANGKVSGDHDFIFYGNLRHSSGCVEHMGDHLTGGAGGDAEQMRVDLSTVPASVERIAFTATLYDAEARRQNFGMVKNAYIRILDEDCNQELLRYDLGTQFSVETAIVVGEIYRYKGEWKFNAIGSGYQGGLAALCGSFGIEVQEGQGQSAGVQQNAAAAEKSSPPVQSQPQKVELRKGQKVSLVKRSGSKLGEISVNLNWEQPKKETGFFGSLFGSKGIDLDLACLYEMKDGSKGVVQALGNCFGSLAGYPYIALDGDDRTGSVAAGETIRINGAKISEFKRILVFTFIYKGAANWKEAKGVVTVKCSGSPDIIVRMDEYGSNKGLCAIAMLENEGDETFSVEKIIRFFDGHKPLDQAFGWGLEWVRGSKD
ncbi:MAG: TerD domain-containing protein [Selenomonadaceae bacterium]|nr:TerD domain-containing protein [Selenomonadaceae bacterium]